MPWGRTLKLQPSAWCRVVDSRYVQSSKTSKRWPFEWSIAEAESRSWEAARGGGGPRPPATCPPIINNVFNFTLWHFVSTNFHLFNFEYKLGGTDGDGGGGSGGGIIQFLLSPARVTFLWGDTLLLLSRSYFDKDASHKSLSLQFDYCCILLRLKV